jgi:hypothetical protein
MSLFHVKVIFRKLLGDRFWMFLRRFSFAPCHVLERICQRETGGIVMTGPFAGMRFTDAAVAGGYVPKLLGTYEKELHEGKNAGVSGRVRSRFEASHDIKTVWQEKRTVRDFPLSTPWTRRFATQHLEAAVDEGRPVRQDGANAMSWFWMVPKGC